MPVGDIIETACVCYGSSQNMINVLHWRVQTVTPTEPTAQEKANAISTFMATQLKSMLSGTASYKGLKYRLLAPTPTSVIISTTSSGVGTRTGDALPSQVCGLLSLRSSVAPPRVRGRLYLPQPVEADNQTSGVPSTTYVTDATTFGAGVFSTHTLTGAGGSCTIIPVIYHRAPPAAFYLIDQVIVRTAWATQRRRSAINRADVSAI